MQKEKNSLPSSKPTGELPESKVIRKEFGPFETRKRNWEERKKPFSPFAQLDRVVLRTKRVTKVTAGGRRFSFASAGLVKDENKKLITFAYTRGKEVPSTFQKMLRKAQRSFTNFSQGTPTPQIFPASLSTIPHDIEFSYKTITLLIKPAPSGSGVRAGGVIRKIFKMIGIKDVSAKIIGSGSNLNITRATFLALSKIN